MNYSRHVSTKKTAGTSQTVKSRADQVRNNAGGFGFKVTKWEQLERFLILGSEGGTFYVGEQKLTRDNAKNVISCIEEDGVAVVNKIVEVSDTGRAPKNDPAIFALALAATHGNQDTKDAAYGAITKVCRIGTHLFHFAQAVQDLRGWSRGLRRGVAAFYTDRRSDDDLAMQIVKYRQRDGWSHRDVIRLAHPKAKSDVQSGIFAYAVGKTKDGIPLPPTILAFEEAQKLSVNSKVDVRRAIALINSFDLPREALPTEMLNSPEIWEALLQKMPLNAMVRNLGKMTSLGLFGEKTNSNTKIVLDALGDPETIHKARLHPMAILQAFKVYDQGHGDKGSLSWVKNQHILSALDDGFYTAFKAVEPTGKSIMLAVDCSGSMFGASIAGMSIDAATATAAMSLVTEAVEKESIVTFFSNGTANSRWSGSHRMNSGIQDLPINSKMRLDKVLETMRRQPWGGTDCALPMVHATKNNLPVDQFVIYTDNETWAGTVKPHEALEEYRQKSGRPAKLVVVGTSASPFTIADPLDSGMLDVVGFDTGVPAVISNFARD